MKLKSYFSVFQKLLLVSAVLLSASHMSAGRSILDQERTEMDSFRSELFGSNGFFRGALTFDNLSHFDYANAGIGTMVFRTSSKQFRPLLIDRDSPRAVGSWTVASESTPFLTPESSQFFVRGRSGAFDDQSGDPLSPDVLAPVPEPSTWFGATLALALVGFMQRRRLRGLLANRT
jgi:hypothetical protein